MSQGCFTRYETMGGSGKHNTSESGKGYEKVTCPNNGSMSLARGCCESRQMRGFGDMRRVVTSELTIWANHAMVRNAS